MERKIITTYFDHRGIAVKINKASTPQNASRMAFDHLQWGDYDARVASVHDDNMGELHAILKVDVRGNISTVFKRDAKTPTCLVMDH